MTVRNKAGPARVTDDPAAVEQQLINEADQSGQLARMRQRIAELKAVEAEWKWAKETLQRRNRELALLNQASRAFSSTLDLDQVLVSVLEEVRRLLGVIACSIWLVDPETDELVCRQAAGPKSEIVRNWRLRPGEGLAGWVVRNGESLIVPDVRTDARHFEGVDSEGELELRSILGVPLQASARGSARGVSQNVIGVLQVVDAQIGRFDVEDLALLEPLAASAAIAIENARLYEQAQQEIVERKRAEVALQEQTHALQESEARFRALSDATFEGIAFTEQGVVVDANQQLVKLLGYEMAEIQGLDVGKFVKPEDREFVRSKVLVGSEEPYEHRALCKDGTTVFVEVRPRMMSIKGRLMRVTAIRDITERKRMEKEQARLLVQIQEQAQQMQQVMDTVPEGVLLLDGDLRILLANLPASEHLAALVGAEAGDILRQGSRRALTHLGSRPLNELLTSPPKSLWHEVEAKGPPRRLFEVIARPTENSAETENWVLVIRDVTQERETQQYIQQQDRLATVGQLAAGIAHDFNNIMATIILYAQILSRRPGRSPREQEQLAAINQQAMHATSLIQQILEFSRSAELEQQSLDLLPLLKEQVRMLERTLPEDIEVELVYGPGQHVVGADPTRMQQVFMNLAINARDAMLEGGTLCIGLERVRVEDRKRAPLPEMEAGEWVRVTVSDTGMGIPADALPRIFDPFFTTKSDGAGTGLGLAQVWGIVNQHKGHIDVKTRVGEGTTFTIYLPAPKDSQPETLAQKETSTLPQGRGEIILVVEDSAPVRQAVTEGLESLNYRPLAAAHGREALALFERYAREPSTPGAPSTSGQEIALVVSDTVMPEMGGVALSHALRKRGYTGQIVMLTGHPVRDRGGDLPSQGVAAWLQKPVSLEQLSKVVARALNGDSV